MSGVYIKGMTIPTSCRACMYSRTDITNTDWCVLTEKDLPCDCPLIQVPEHGRLIDADALPETRVEWEDVINAPTIIPADKEGEE